MPKTAYFPEGAGRSGIDITWYKTTATLSISGWYDSMVGIEGESLSLKEFFTRLGITEKDIKKALKEK